MPDQNTQAPENAADQARMAFVLSLRERGISDLDVLRALETIPREKFVPRKYSDVAWREISLPIACGQIMPDPYTVAGMVEALSLRPDQRVLEVGTGSGYVTAILSQLCGELVSFERYNSLHVEAKARLEALAIENAALFRGDGMSEATLATAAPWQFDRIVIHAALEHGIPEHLEKRLLPNGRILFGACAGEEGAAMLQINSKDKAGAFRQAPLLAARLSVTESGMSQFL